MMTGDEFFDDDITSPRDATAFVREWERANPTCQGCGYPFGARGPGQCACDDLDDTYDRDYEYFQYAEAA